MLGKDTDVQRDKASLGNYQITGANKAPTWAGGGKSCNLSELGFSICKMGIIISHAVDLKVNSYSGEERLWQSTYKPYFK